MDGTIEIFQFASADKTDVAALGTRDAKTEGEMWAGESCFLSEFSVIANIAIVLLMYRGVKYNTYFPQEGQDRWHMQGSNVHSCVCSGQLSARTSLSSVLPYVL